MLAGLRGDRSVKEVCREHAISETLYESWREKLLEGGRETLAGKEERAGERELRRKVAGLERALGRKTYELEIAGKLLRELGVRQRVARSRDLVAEGHSPSMVARVAGIGRQALYRTPTPPRLPQQRSPVDAVEWAIIVEALASQSDGYRMICAFVRQRLGIAVNRKRVLRVMRERKLIQRRRPLERRKRPGFLRVERPRQLWQLDMSSVWVAEHGWCYPNAIIDCCTREIVAWQLEPRCRADEVIAVVERSAAAYAIEPGELVLGSDNGSAFTARRFKAKLAELGIRRLPRPRKPGLHRELVRETQAKGGVAERARNPRRRPPRIGGYVERYHHRPHSGLNYRTPIEVRRTCGRINKDHRNSRPNPSTPVGSRSRVQSTELPLCCLLLLRALVRGVASPGCGL